MPDDLNVQNHRHPRPRIAAATPPTSPQPQINVPRAFAPAAAEERIANYERMMSEWAESRQALKASVENAKAAEKADQAADVDRRVAGEDPLPASKRRHPPAAQKVAEAERDTATYKQAVQRAHELMVEAIIDSHTDWTDAATTAQHEAEEEFRRALDDLDAATAKLAAARGARRWLNGVDTDRREIPQRTVKAAVKVKFSAAGDGVTLGENNVETVVAALRQVPDPPPVRTYKAPAAKIAESMRDRDRQRASEGKAA